LTNILKELYPNLQEGKTGLEAFPKLATYINICRTPHKTTIQETACD
jgi:hypothetical protein